VTDGTEKVPQVILGQLCIRGAEEADERHPAANLRLLPILGPEEATARAATKEAASTVSHSNLAFAASSRLPVADSAGPAEPAELTTLAPRDPADPGGDKGC